MGDGKGRARPTLSTPLNTGRRWPELEPGMAQARDAVRLLGFNLQGGMLTQWLGGCLWPVYHPLAADAV